MSSEPSIQITRRAFGTLAFGAALAPWTSRAAAPSDGPRFFTPDHGLAQTLVSIGANLVGVSQRPNWETWTVEPPLPPEVANLGTSQETNLELLQRLEPDLIVSTPYLERVRHQFERIAPVESFPIHAVGGSPWPNILDATRRLGSLAGLETEAEALVAETEKAFVEAHPKLAALRSRKLVFLHFVDRRHVRIYGPNCIIQDVLDRLEIENGWTHGTNGWGFATAGVERLADIGDAWVLIFEPVPPDVEARLAGSPLWQNLPFVRAGRVRRFPNVLAFGTLPGARRMTRLLTELDLSDG
ncbi:ABC transporter substrate-binding protein [Nisaea acidiphila]|uniref:ABC transporter substrate-binding protein n=1 Tax=Nisaea acidiphila TaxID=1862145 RepID=A0A9J7ASG3_9PROT|nr:ABC transporter substrate-binding protein [Nisaea acidiphila]UUX49284.1 ABC transporter substrate-binding protein [Nisaea acidiphila]